MDITQAGSFHQFLVNLHQKYGDIASFWMGEQLTVSIASPELFKQHSKPYNRPNDFFMLFEPIFTMDSIGFKNNEEWRSRRQTYDKAFTHQALTRHCDSFIKNVFKLADKWDKIPDGQHIPLQEAMFSLTTSSLAETLFGDLFQNEDEVLELGKNYFVCWAEMEKRLAGDLPNEGSERLKEFDRANNDMHEILKRAIAIRRQIDVNIGEELLIDIIMQSTESENIVVADCITYLVAGIHNISALLIWCLYQLGLNPDLQQKVHQEMIDVLGEESVTAESASFLKYTKQVLNETHRWAILAPFAARVEDEPIKLGKHILAPGTPVIQAFGVVFHNPTIWPNPSRFDPSRFDSSSSRIRSMYAFQPFGFAGKRKCPGSNYTYASAIAFLSVLLRKFKFKVVRGQDIYPVYGLATLPREEVWITLEKIPMPLA